MSLCLVTELSAKGSIRVDKAGTHLSELRTQKSMGLGRMFLRMPRMLADATLRLMSVNSER